MSHAGPTDRLAQLIAGTQLLLLDFDGPICSIFAGVGAATVASRLRQVLAAADIELSPEIVAADDPLEILKYAGAHSGELAVRMHQQLTREEVSAVASAEATAHATDVLVAVRRTGRHVTIVSNNSAEAIGLYLERHRLAALVDHTVGRASDPTLMKPNPYLVSGALTLGDTPSEFSILVGDSPADIAAAKTVGVKTVGYANKPGKRHLLMLAGADAVITSMRDLADALA